jgi:hypothetical protein
LLQYVQRRGFTKSGGEEVVVLDLAEIADLTTEPPAGLRIVSRGDAPDTVEGMYEVAREAEPDIPAVHPCDRQPRALVRASLTFGRRRRLVPEVGNEGKQCSGIYARCCGDNRPGASLDRARPSPALRVPVTVT